MLDTVGSCAHAPSPPEHQQEGTTMLGISENSPDTHQQQNTGRMVWIPTNERRFYQGHMIALQLQASVGWLKKTNNNKTIILSKKRESQECMDYDIYVKFKRA